MLSVETGCYRKLRFEHRKSAQDHLARLVREKGLAPHEVTIYMCSVCKKFHIGHHHRKGVKRRAARERRAMREGGA